MIEELFKLWKVLLSSFIIYVYVSMFVKTHIFPPRIVVEYKILLVRISMCIYNKVNSICTGGDIGFELSGLWIIYIIYSEFIWSVLFIIYMCTHQFM